MNKSKYPYGRDPKREPQGFEKLKGMRLPETGSSFVMNGKRKPKDRSNPDFPPGH